MTTQPDPEYQQLGQESQGNAVEELLVIGLVALLWYKFRDSWWLFIASYLGLFWICAWHWELPAITMGIAVVAYAIYQIARAL